MSILRIQKVLFKALGHDWSRLFSAKKIISFTKKKLSLTNQPKSSKHHWWFGGGTHLCWHNIHPLRGFGGFLFFNFIVSHLGSGCKETSWVPSPLTNMRRYANTQTHWDPVNDLVIFFHTKNVNVGYVHSLVHADVCHTTLRYRPFQRNTYTL